MLRAIADCFENEYLRFENRKFYEAIKYKKPFNSYLIILCLTIFYEHSSAKIKQRLVGIFFLLKMNAHSESPLIINCSISNV